MAGVRIAIVGCGVIGKRHAGVIAARPEVDLVAIADPSAFAKATAARFGVPCHEDVEQFLATEQVDGVIVSTPTTDHLSPTMAALDASVSVLVEKPIAASLEDADRIVARSEERSVPVLVGHHRRYHPQLRQARDILRSGRLGQLVAVCGQWTVRKSPEYFSDDWRRTWQAGPTLINLTHDLDSLRYICGDVESVSAEMTSMVMGTEKEDAAAIVLRFRNGALGTFVMSDQTPSPWAWELSTGETPAFPKSGRNSLRFMGTRASLDFPNLVLWHHGDGPSDWTQPILPQSIPHEPVDAFDLQISHFAEVASGRNEPRITARDGTETLRTTLAVFEAARSGKRVLLCRSGSEWGAGIGADSFAE
ncbi:MAG: Gfo/Idh/MocA family oxidoreductase [Paracoccaceae bacterium]|nr:Gfo/Idh/MocA family oxidoreductase [Paracoccaceae bacterium]MDE2911321.1 Gfo/Idh/MocA family oxidoreductase [Paracoccaceae bacterium]